MRRTNRHSEKGISLLMCVLMLMLLTAVAAGMMFLSSTETAINGNFKSEETAYFAARAGAEEARDRMLTANINSISGLLPTVLTPTTNGVLYILQNGVAASDITDFTKSTADDELCHNYPAGGGSMSYVPPNVRCTTLPSSGTGWFTSTASVAPYPLEYKWTRITLKANNSTPYPVSGAAGVNQLTASGTQVCWDGAEKILSAASCIAMAPQALPVYLVTSLAVMPSGARRLVQQELAQNLLGGLPGGLFAVGTGCGALNIQGNAQTGSFNSSTEGTPTNPPSNQALTNGDIGANGGISVGGTSTAVNGSISTNLPASIGNCPVNGVTESGTPGVGGLTHLSTPFTATVPPMPNPLPPQTNVTYRSQTLTPGAYGNVTIQNTVHLAGGADVNHPAVYTMNSLNENGNATLVIDGPVVINFAGVGVNTVVDLTGNSFTNSSNVPANFVINYGGPDAVKIGGGSDAYGIINAPNAPLSFQGGSNFYGQAIGNTIDDHGGTSFYWDLAINTPTPPTTSFQQIAFRELTY